MSHHNHGKIRLVGSSEGVDGNLTPPDPVGAQHAQEAQEAPATDAGTVVSAMSSRDDRAQLPRTHRSWG